MDYQQGYRDASRLLGTTPRPTTQAEAPGANYSTGFLAALYGEVPFRPLNEV